MPTDFPLLRCPACGGAVVTTAAAPSPTGDDEVVCAGCQARYPSHCGVVDLREDRARTCWTTALTRPEDDLVRDMVEQFPGARLEALADLYTAAHRLPERLASGQREY